MIIIFLVGLALPRAQLNNTSTTLEPILEADAEAFEFGPDLQNGTETITETETYSEISPSPILDEGAFIRDNYETTTILSDITTSTPTDEISLKNFESTTILSDITTPATPKDEILLELFKSTTILSDIIPPATPKDEISPKFVPKKSINTSEALNSPNAQETSAQTTSTAFFHEEEMDVTSEIEKEMSTSSPAVFSDRNSTNDKEISTFAPIKVSARPNDTFSTRPFWLNSSTNKSSNAEIPVEISPTTMVPEPKLNPNTTEDSLHSLHEIDSMKQCPSSEKWIGFDQLCDGIVQCPEATDEINCTCVDKIGPSKVCDGVFDCPNLEDEIGCRGCIFYFNYFIVFNANVPIIFLGCNSTQFNCDDTRKTCISSKQRCDGIKQCPDGRDEVGCSILSPSLEPLEVHLFCNSQLKFNNCNNHYHFF